MKNRKRRQPRNAFEQKVWSRIQHIPGAEYEPTEIPYTLSRTYRPDFCFKVGQRLVYVETKGHFDRDARAKMAAVREQHPALDIRLVFVRASNRLSAKSKMTYAEWAEKHGFKWAEGQIPKQWFKK